MPVSSVTRQQHTALVICTQWWRSARRKISVEHITEPTTATAAS